MKKLLGMTAAIALSAGVAMAEKWDMPMAYADSNYHSQTGKQFAKCVGTATGGEIEITVHAGGSLFKGNEIKRAVQTGQAPIGERLLSAHQNENAVFGVREAKLFDCVGLEFLPQIDSRHFGARESP